MQSTKNVVRIKNGFQEAAGTLFAGETGKRKGRTDKRNKPQRGRSDSKYFDSLVTNEEGATI
ncbi:MAG: hypothetical protein [Caudoviricetes sp.]|nr:MAG: hypothetical protein [Caudoviricetes sp.]